MRATLAASLSDRASLTAAGCAFYATLALFPAISILISIYGLAFNPGGVSLQHADRAAALVGRGMLVGFAALSIALLYRFGPSRRPPPARRIAPGTLLATSL